jgi:hypothetical protein
MISNTAAPTPQKEAKILRIRKEKKFHTKYKSIEKEISFH